MLAKTKPNETAQTTVRNSIHITSRDKERLEKLLTEAAATLAQPPDLQALAQELKRAVVVDPDEIPADVITMNSRAEMKDLETGEQLTFTLVFPSQANIEEEKISVLAPIGAGMLVS